MTTRGGLSVEKLQKLFKEMARRLSEEREYSFYDRSAFERGFMECANILEPFIFIADMASKRGCDYEDGHCLSCGAEKLLRGIFEENSNL